MKSLIIVLLLITLAYSQSCASDETLFNYQCIKNSCFDIYLPRFKTVPFASQTGGVGKIPITFAGYVQWTKSDVEVMVQFTDDDKNDGTMKRDNTNSCIDSKLFNYKTDYTQEVADSSTITSSYDESTRYRVWKFTIKSSDLNTKLVSDGSVAGKITYRGYYGLKFYVADQLQVTYKFQFSLELDTNTNSVLSTSFNPLVQEDKASCNPTGKCIQKAESSLQFCTESSCGSPSYSINLYLNQYFWIIQKITTAGFETFKLLFNSVTVQGQGLSRKLNPQSVNTSTSGQMILGLKVEFAYDTAVSLYVDSKLSASGRRVLQRILAESTNETDPAHASQSTGEIKCIKLNESDTECPTCDQLMEKGITCSSKQTSTIHGSKLLFALAFLLVLFI